MINTATEAAGISLKTVGVEGNIVREFSIGNTKIKICDDYCRDKTKQDVERILERIASNAQAKLSAQH